jgi:cytochrome c oxidase cbb3-type subunit III
MSSHIPDQVLGHADDCDGIDEYDNRLPTWWLGIFALCVLWGVGYGVHYHFVGNRSQAGEYDNEVAAAMAQWPEPEAGATLVATADAVEAGKALYATNCIGCHAADLTGGIGPNLIDAEWVHGGTLDEINKTVSEGVPAKGMLAWGPILGPAKVAQVSAYVHSAGGGQ